jgi:unsaturated chondroitin disaccharide hydrolase
MAYRETGDPRFLETARRTADWFLAELPTDSVPFWDFDAPGIPDEPRDSSAAAIAASGLLELALRDPEPARRSRYLESARTIVVALSSRAYLSAGSPSMAVLLHGTSNKPKGNFDTGLVYGDYYLSEALLRLRLIEPAAPPLAVAGVRASADDGNVAANTLDGDHTTRWSALGSGQWIELDFGKPTLVAKVSLAFHMGDSRAARFRIETSTDAATWSPAAAALSSGRTSGPETFDVPDREARYVRIVGDGNSRNAWNRITEVDVR